MITIVANGIEYKQLVSISVESSLRALARSFSIEIVRPLNEQLPFRGGEQIQILIDDELVCDGFVDVVTEEYSANGKVVSLQGRSKAQDLIDSNLLPLTISGNVSLVKVIENVISQIGLDLKVINKVSDLKDFDSAEDKIGAEGGESAFFFIDELARKRQVLLTSDASGNVVITRTGTARNDILLKNIVNGDSNFISGGVTYNASDIYNKYVVLSQLNTTTDLFSLDSDQAVSQQAESLNKNIRPRQLVMISEKSSSNDELKKRADWKNNISTANKRRYNIIVQGFRQEGTGVWETNTLQRVVDEFADINDTLLIDSVRFTQSAGEGSTTILSLVDKSAYDQLLAEPIAKEEVDNGLFA